MSLDAMQETPVRELLETRPLFLEGERVSKAIGYFRENREYEVFVRKERKLSIVSVRDLISVKDPNGEKLGTAVYFAPELKETDSVGKAARLMFDYRIRSIPLTERDGEVDVVSAQGMARMIAGARDLRVGATDVMTSSPITIQAGDTALKAREIMVRRSIDHLPVMEGRKLVGVLTSSDLLLNLLPEEGAHPQTYAGQKAVRFDYPVRRIMGETPVEVDASSKLNEVVNVMLKKRSSYALVTLLGEVQGIVTLRDVVKPLVKRDKSKTPFYIVGLPDEPFEGEGAKMKFERMSETLSRAFPFIQEIRAIVKRKETGGEKKRYEVHVNLYTRRDVYAYSEEGYELPDLFDAIVPKLKRLLSSKQSKVTRTQGRTLRKMQ